MVLILILMMAMFGGTPHTQWQCQNDLEIRCDGGHCKAEKEGEFTPMSVSFDDKGMISVCAYSGCWEGTGKVHKKGDFMMLTGKNLSFSTSPGAADKKQNILIALDKSDSVAMLKAGEFAHPLVCGPPANK